MNKLLCLILIITAGGCNQKNKENTMIPQILKKNQVYGNFMDHLDLEKEGIIEFFKKIR